jgi:hypothetical protein
LRLKNEADRIQTNARTWSLDGESALAEDLREDKALDFGEWQPYHVRAVSVSGPALRNTQIKPEIDD